MSGELILSDPQPLRLSGSGVNPAAAIVGNGVLQSVDGLALPHNWQIGQVALTLNPTGTVIP